MTSQKKLISIAVISFVFSVASFFIMDGNKNPNIFMNVFEIGMLTALVFLLLVINFFALVFCFKRIRTFLANRR